MIDLPERFNRGNGSAWAVKERTFFKVWKDRPAAVDWLSSADYAVLASEKIVARFLGAYDLRDPRRVSASRTRDALLREDYIWLLIYELLDLEPLRHDLVVGAPNHTASFIYRLSKFFSAAQDGGFAFHDLDRTWRNILHVAHARSPGHVAVVDVDSCFPVTMVRDRLRSISTGSTDFWGFWIAARDRNFARFNILLFGLIVASSIVGVSLNCADCLRMGCLPDGRRLDRFFGQFLRRGGGEQELARRAAGRIEVGELHQVLAEIFQICRDGNGASDDIRRIADTAIEVMKKNAAQARRPPARAVGSRSPVRDGRAGARGAQVVRCPEPGSRVRVRRQPPSALPCRSCGRGLRRRGRLRSPVR